MKNCGRRNIRKQIEIKGSDKYVILNISLKSDSLNRMEITSSESEDNLGRSGKGLITYLGFKFKSGPKEYKKARHAIGNISKKKLSKMIGDFEKLPFKS